MTPREIIDILYPETDPFASQENFDRAHHRDIVAMSLEAIEAELFLARLRASTLIHHRIGEPSDWLVERRRRLAQAAAKRRGLRL
jgi:hypothetical protein